MAFHFYFDTRIDIPAKRLGNLGSHESSHQNIDEARLTARKTAEMLGAKSFSIENDVGHMLELCALVDGAWQQRPITSADETTNGTPQNRNPKGHIVCSMPDGRASHTSYYSEEGASQIEQQCAKAGGTANRIPAY